MKIDSLKIFPEKRSPARTSADAHAAARSGGGAGGTQTAEQERRRGQRVMLRVKIQIHVALQGKPTTFEATTVSVNVAGALVVVERSLLPGMRLVVEHGSTQERVACKVVRAPRETPEGFHTALEFDSPAPNFWKIAFPPPGWRVEDV